jgi:colanic acid/amylovoran biosynthesis glycosyltransferase
MQARLRLAYITTHYPALSHTFILREVEALRRLGTEIHTISLRRSSGEHLLSRENREAARHTYAIRPPRWRAVLVAHFAAAAAHPRAYVRTLREALSLARPGLSGRLWQLFYFAEAILAWRHCAAREITHIHAHHGSPPADVALLAADFGSRADRGPRSWSLTVHGSVEFWNVRWFRLSEKVRRAAAVVCISDFARSQLMALVEEDQWSKLHVVHCGVAPGDYEGLQPQRGGRPMILYVARLVSGKGHAVLFQALARLRELGHDADLVLVGGGPMEASLRQLATRLGLEGRVTFAASIGHEEVRRHYADASVFCLPSFAEGVPVVLMEAMASERPVVATAVGGVRELVRDGDTGLLVSPGRADELANAIALLLERPQLRTRIVRSARAHVLREFDIERSAIQLQGLFQEILGIPQPPSAYPARTRGTLERTVAGDALEPLPAGTSADRAMCG